MRAPASFEANGLLQLALFVGRKADI
ncbi:hypothetical protein SBBP2_2160011 [Burkholderiales bacterium]|nr:hypothetical protein SBBP2_2160011 [Burkholderiales bacterium]